MRHVMVKWIAFAWVVVSPLATTGTVHAEEPMQVKATSEFLVCLAFSPDGRTIATGGYDKVVRVWNTSTGRLRTEFKGHKDWVMRLAFTPDGKTLASSDEYCIKFWDIATSREQGSFNCIWGTLELAISPDGETFTKGGPDNSIILCDLSTGKELKTFRGHTGLVTSVAYSPDGKTLASAGDDKTTRLWDIVTGRERATLRGHTENIEGIAFSPDGRILATASSDKTARLWDIITAKETARFTHNNWLSSLAFSSTGKTLAVGSEGRILLLDSTELKYRTTLECGVPIISDRNGAIYAIAFSPDGKRLAAANGLGTLLIWDAAEVLKRVE